MSVKKFAAQIVMVSWRRFDPRSKHKAKDFIEICDTAPHHPRINSVVKVGVYCAFWTIYDLWWYSQRLLTKSALKKVIPQSTAKNEIVLHCAAVSAIAESPE